MTDAFIALATPSRSQRLTAWLTVAVMWGMTAQAWGLLRPLGIAPLVGTDAVGRVLGLAVAIAITALAIVLVPRRGALRLRIDADGIDWRFRPGRRRVRWDEVERIGDRPLTGMAKMAVDMTGETASAAQGPTSIWLKSSARRGLNAAGNRALGYGDLNLTTIGTDRTRAELRAALQHFAAAHVTRDDAPESTP